MPESHIQNVSDTALWVANYRAVESERADALFQDPLAKKLCGEKGKVIAKHSVGSMYVSWTVIIRTVIIDRYIQERIAEGVDLVLNLGAGLDTRPYRMNLPENLKWVEVDFPNIIDLKEKELASEKPRCKLTRMRVDLSNPEAAQKCFAEVSSIAKNILVLTEGVSPYLTNDQVAALGRGLSAQANFQYWIIEYMSPQLTKFLQNPKRMRYMKNAPFRFNPENWTEFFKAVGWTEKETTYLADESLRLKRPIPGPFWVKLIRPFIPKKRRAELRKFSGFTLLERRK